MKEFNINTFLSEYNIELSRSEFHLRNIILKLEHFEENEDTITECLQQLEESFKHIYAVREKNWSTKTIDYPEDILKLEKVNQLIFCKIRIISIIYISKIIIKSHKIPDIQISKIYDIIAVLSLIIWEYLENIKLVKENFTSKKISFLDIDKKETDSFLNTSKNYENIKKILINSSLEKIKDTLHVFKRINMLISKCHEINAQPERNEHSDKICTFEFDVAIDSFNIKRSMFDYEFSLLMSAPSIEKEDRFFSQIHEHLTYLCVGINKLVSNINITEYIYQELRSQFFSNYIYCCQYNQFIADIFHTSKEKEDRYSLNTDLLNLDLIEQIHNARKS